MKLIIVVTINAPIMSLKCKVGSSPAYDNNNENTNPATATTNDDLIGDAVLEANTNINTSNK